MPAINFQKQFVAAVQSGDKRQTIRARRRDGRNPRVGQTAHLYYGLRTKQVRKLGEAPITEVTPVTIDGDENELGELLSAEVRLANRPELFLEQFAANDGFESFEEMVRWFQKTHGLPFEGLLIKWGEIEP